jgi:hypothetical protein
MTNNQCHTVYVKPLAHHVHRIPLLILHNRYFKQVCIKICLIISTYMIVIYTVHLLAHT